MICNDFRTKSNLFVCVLVLKIDIGHILLQMIHLDQFLQVLEEYRNESNVVVLHSTLNAFD